MKLQSGIRFLSILVGALLLTWTSVAAAEEYQKHPVSAVLENHDSEIDSDIALYFRGENTPSVAEEHGEYTANRRTKATRRSDDEACQWVMLSALLALQERAESEGGNAVVDIRSIYKDHEMEDGSQYECEAGFIMAGAALRGKVVTLSE